MRFYITLLVSIVPLGVFAQFPFQTVQQLAAHSSTAQLATPWLGGLNNPLFSDIDLNDDNFQDLWIFDASEDKFYTFLNDGIADSVSFTYAPEYVKWFPHVRTVPFLVKPALHDWAFLVDYNCDGLEDIFTYHGAGCVVYRASRNGNNEIEFTLADDLLTFKQGQFDVNIYMSSIDYPAIVDVDNDGDIDILTFEQGGATIGYFQNQSDELGYGCDSLIFERQTQIWGGVVEDAATFRLYLDQGLTAQLPDGDGGPRHFGGSALLGFDQDDDDDIDLIVSDVDFDFNIYLHNGNPGSNRPDTIVWQDTTFPNYNVPTDIPNFPSASYLDLNNDDWDDLLFAPFARNNCRLDLALDTAINMGTLWFYEGIGPINNKQFELRQTDLFASDMIDIGENSLAAFFDYNADGLLDIVAGSCYQYNPNQELILSLVVYENTGSAMWPEFTAATNDYHNFDSLQLIGLHPTFGDLDDDGDQDMICGTATGRLLYFENSAGAGNPAQFAYVKDFIDSTFFGSNTTPQLVDVNRDTLLDLIVGEYNGTIRYLENIGSAQSAQFQKISSNWGGVDVRDGAFFGYSDPELVPDGPGNTYRLYVGNQTGKVYLFDNIEGNLTGTFDLVAESVVDTTNGARLSPTFADINSDSQPEMLLGTARGGLIMTSMVDWTVGVGSIPNDVTSIAVYPNPASDAITVRLTNQATTSWHLAMFDLSGRQVLANTAIGQNQITLSAQSLAPGVYTLKVWGENFRDTVKVVIAR